MRVCVRVICERERESLRKINPIQNPLSPLLLFYDRKTTVWILNPRISERPKNPLFWPKMSFDTSAAAAALDRWYLCDENTRFISLDNNHSDLVKCSLWRVLQQTKISCFLDEGKNVLIFFKSTLPTLYLVLVSLDLLLGLDFSIGSQCTYLLGDSECYIKLWLHNHMLLALRL